MKKCLKVIGMGAALLALYGCGDGGGGGAASGPVADSFVFPAGKATLTFSVMSSARPPAPSISGIDLSIKLPSGMSVDAVAGASGPIVTASVMPGSGLVGTNLAFGTYSASNGKTRLSMATTSDTYRLGEFLRLTCTVASGTSITLADLKALNVPVPVLKAVGYDPVTKSTVNFGVKVALGAVR